RTPLLVRVVIHRCNRFPRRLKQTAFPTLDAIFRPVDPQIQEGWVKPVTMGRDRKSGSQSGRRGSESRPEVDRECPAAQRTYRTHSVDFEYKSGCGQSRPPCEALQRCARAIVTWQPESSGIGEDQPFDWPRP